MRRFGSFSAALVAAVGVAAQAALPASVRSPREEANLVVNRFLVAAALGDRGTACALYPGYDPCARTGAFRGSADFRVLAIAVLGRNRVVVTVARGKTRGSFDLRRSGGSFAIADASDVLDRAGGPAARTARATASLVVTRFLLASALGDSRTACALYPGFFPCTSRAVVHGSADFTLVGVTLADPARPAVFANVDGVRGYFVLERRGGTLEIVFAGLD
jgi:hypothetical protein